jgi:hypothetical protein
MYGLNANTAVPSGIHGTKFKKCKGQQHDMYIMPTIIQKFFGTRKPNGINRTAKVGLDQIRLREENFSFNNTKMYLHYLQY